VTDTGRERRNNEDGVVACDFATGTGHRQAVSAFFAVSDGMGGHNAGEIAAMTAIRSVADTLTRRYFLPALRLDVYQLPDRVYNYHFRRAARRPARPSARRVLAAALGRANDAIIDLSRKNPAFFGMGATLTAAVLADRRLTVASVGDSRCYVHAGGRLQQVTKDHTIVNQMVELGRISAEDAAHHPGRNFLYKSLGSTEALEFDLFELELAPPAWLMICSDGLTGMVPDADIARVLDGCRLPQHGAAALVRLANRAGGKDNISVVLARLT
jgi:protein phosphatase